MAVDKPQGSTFVDRAVQWVKDVGDKVKAATGNLAKSGSAKSEYMESHVEYKLPKPTLQQAKKFEADVKKLFKETKGPVVDILPSSIHGEEFMSGPDFTVTKGPVVNILPESYGRESVRVNGESMRTFIPDDKMRALLSEALKDPEFKKHIGDLKKALKPYEK